MPPEYPKEWWEPFSMDEPLCQDKTKKDRQEMGQKTRHALRNLTCWIKQRWYLTVIVLGALLFTKSFTAAITIIILLALSVMLNMQKILIERSIGVETVTFSAVLISVAINPVFGFVFAMTTIILSMIIHGKAGTFLFVKIPAYALMCFAASTFPATDIMNAGILAAFLGNAIFLTSTFFLNSEKIWGNIFTSAVNIMLNAWLFMRFGEALLGVLIV